MSISRRTGAVTVAVAVAVAGSMVGALVATGTAYAAGWTVVATPNATAQRHQFSAVTTTGWAVGTADFPTAPWTRPLVAQWNGSAWSLAATPALATDAVLAGVDADSAGNAWAVGSVGSSTLTERWNGTSWSVVPSPGTGLLRGVRSVDANNAWAVGEAGGRTLVTHWDGTVWSTAASPNPDPSRNLLVAVDGTGNDLWAAGNMGSDGYGSGTVAGLVLHWNGTTWSQVALPTDQRFSTIELRDVAVVGTNDVWVVGTAFSMQAFTTVPYVAHWTGQGWQQAPVGGAGGGFRGVTAAGGTVYAVGGTDTGQTLVTRWTGTGWVREATPSPSYSGLSAAAATGTGTVLTVGFQLDPGYTMRTLAIHSS